MLRTSEVDKKTPSACRSSAAICRTVSPLARQLTTKATTAASAGLEPNAAGLATVQE
jgi:hypothetical protein